MSSIPRMRKKSAKNFDQKILWDDRQMDLKALFDFRFSRVNMKDQFNYLSFLEFHKELHFEQNSENKESQIRTVLQSFWLTDFL